MTRSSFRPVMIAVACAVLAAALSGCGRKGPLDLPPQAESRASVAPVAAAEEQDRGPGTIVDQTLREQEPPLPRGGKRKFILDPLLGD